MRRDELVQLMSAQPQLVRVLEILETSGYVAHLVGGSVRDALMGRPVNDLDVATSARPDAVTSLFEAEGFTVHPTGIEHGTVTVVADGAVFEITTWRRDVETDGRRAVVAYADTLEEDALRRDFTFNALYADRQGCVVDPTGLGLADADRRRVRFVGIPEERIREDALRILRFYRFHAVLESDLEQGPDLDACERLKDLASNLSRERVGAEMLKTIKAPGWVGSMVAMDRSGLLADMLPDLAVSGDDLHARMARTQLQERLQGLRPCVLRRLAALVDAAPKDALKLSRSQVRQIDAIISAASSSAAPAELGYRFGVEIAEEALLRRVATGEQDSLPSEALFAALDGARQVFPVKAADLMDRLAGKALGDELRRLEAAWIADGFRLSETA